MTLDSLFSIEFVTEDWDGFRRVRRLEYEVLYRPFGVSEDDDWYHEGPGIHAVALSRAGQVLGSARLLGSAGEDSRQLRQLVVEPAMQRQGIGRALVQALEDLAGREGASEVWLNARDTAYLFYERLGYEYDSEEFLSQLTRVPHRKMSKRLGAWAKA